MSCVDRLIALVDEWTGIRLENSGSAESLSRLLGSRIEALGLGSEEEYVEKLQGPLRDERERLVNAVTINFTWFHRDPDQMQAIAGLLRTGWPPGRAIHAWAAGCATGEDAYTLAMLAEVVGREAYVLGTDLNSANVASAREGRYGPWSMRELPEDLRRFFVAQGAGLHAVKDELKRRVSFAEHNLLDAPPAPASGHGWDLVLCRNVLIYFSPARAEEARARIGTALSPGGWLLLGGSEALWREPPGLCIAWLGGRAALRRPPLAAGPCGSHHADPVSAGAPEPLSVAGPREDALSLVLEGERLMQSDLPRAIGCFLHARDADPLCVEAHLQLGIGLHLMGDAIGAVPALRAALFLDPHLWPAAFYLALSYETLGQPQDARREYQRILETSDGEVSLALRGALQHLEVWKPDVLALASRRATGDPR